MKDMDAVRRNFADMNTEALLEEHALHSTDYEPEALEILRRELLSRGVGKEDLDKAAAAVSEQRADPGETEVVASFDTLVFAQQAQDILAQKGMDGSLQGQGSAVWGMESAAAVPGAVELLVLKKDVDAARTALEEFTPVAEEREGVTLEAPPEDEPGT